MTFFYDLNKRLQQLAGKEQKQQITESTDVAERATGDYSATKARAGKDIGKPGKNFEKIAKSAAERYGSKERGEKVAGAVLAKLRAKEGVEEQYILEKDVEEGNEFSGELARARASGAKEFKVDGKTYQVKEAAKPDFLDLDKDGNKKESMKKAAADKKKNAFDPEVARSMFAPEKGKTKTGHEVKDTGYSKRYTKSLRDEPEANDDDDATPKKKGRKAVGAGKGKKIGAKSHGTSKLASKGSIAENSSMNMVVQATGHAADLINRIQQNGQVDPKELMTKLRAIHSTLSKIQGGSAVTIAEDDMIPLVDKGEYDREGDMALNQLHQIEDAAEELHSILDADENLPEWVQSKITKAVDYIDTARDYMKAKKQQYTSRDEIAEPVAEKAVSKQQQKFMGMAHAMQKGDKIKGASPELKKVAKSMKKSDVEDFAATKHKGLPKKVKEADVEPKAAGGIQFGKGVYESINSRVENMIAEGMNVSVNISTDAEGKPTKNITVSAEGAEAEALAQLLNLAGMAKHSHEQVDEVDENNPDWPTDSEVTGDDDPHLERWAGGLNKPKSTGQTTGAPINRQLARQGAGKMAEGTDLGLNLYKELQQYKGK